MGRAASPNFGKHDIEQYISFALLGTSSSNNTAGSKLRLGCFDHRIGEDFPFPFFAMMQCAHTQLTHYRTDVTKITQQASCISDINFNYRGLLKRPL